MVGVAQLVEHGIVTPVVEGSIPFVHPIFRKNARLIVWRFCFKSLACRCSRVMVPDFIAIEVALVSLGAVSGREICLRPKKAQYLQRDALFFGLYCFGCVSVGLHCVAE